MIIIMTAKSAQKVSVVLDESLQSGVFTEWILYSEFNKYSKILLIYIFQKSILRSIIPNDK